MLPYISTQKDYARFHREAKSLLSETEQNRLHKKKFRKALRKMLMLEPERVKLLLLACYAKTGRPALDPIVTLRSFVLMLHFGYTSVDNWVNEVKDDRALQYLIGDWHVPSVASHYDFINRLLRVKPHLDELYMKGKTQRPIKINIANFTKARSGKTTMKAIPPFSPRSIGITPIVISAGLPALSKTSLTSLLSAYLSRSS